MRCGLRLALVELVSDCVRRAACLVEADHELLALGRPDREAIRTQRPHFDDALRTLQGEERPCA